MTDTATQCRNCGAAIDYHFCAVCGQETRLHVPSAGEFIHEFVGHYIAIEGKLWRTVWMLLAFPGRLTADYLEGRRARYVQPLRVYLSFSLIFFAVLKFGGVEMANWDQDRTRPAESREKLVQATPAESQAFEQWANKLNPEWGSKATRFAQLPGNEMARIATSGFFQYGPYALFCLLPLFAAYLKLLYAGSGRRYGEHLLFAMHTNAFAYLMMMLFMATDWGLVQAASMGWLLLYLPLAMRRVYGGGRIATFLRWGTLMLLHMGSLSLAIMAAFALAVIR
jgi:hypothetical protein